MLNETTASADNQIIDDGDTSFNDYFDISNRASWTLQQPHWIISLVLITLVISSNSVSLVAILTIKGKLTSHFRLLVSLAFSDMLVATSLLLYLINTIANPRLEPGSGPSHRRLVSYCVFMVIKALNTMGLIITLLSLIGMSIDAYIAMVRPTYYATTRNRARSLCLIVCLWILAFLCGFSDFIFSAYGFVVRMPNMSKTYNYCEFTYISRYQEEYTMFACTFIGLLTMSALYCRIYYLVKSKPRPGSTQQGRNCATARERRVLFTTVIIIATFVVCFLPVCLLNLSLIIIFKVNGVLNDSLIRTLTAAERNLLNLFLLNGVIDPIIYTVRIPEVQQSYKRLICRKRLNNRHHLESVISKTAQEEETVLMTR